MLSPKPIVITLPKIGLSEPKVWIELFEAGLERLHVRKPKTGAEEIRYLIKKLPQEYYSKLVIHHHPELVKEYGLGGLHLSYEDFFRFDPGSLSAETSLSVSVHSWNEARKIGSKADYQFISPVFDSVSKSGYPANRALRHVPEDLKGLKMYALGGVAIDNYLSLKGMGYVGGVLLGELWDKGDTPLGQYQKFIALEKI